MVTGIRVRQEKSRQPSPIVVVTISSPEAASPGEAPTPSSPARTTAKEDVNPTTAVTMPATTA